MDAQDTKIITLDELRANKTREKFYILVHGKGTPVSQSSHSLFKSRLFLPSVYNVTKFMDEVCHQLNYS